MRTFASIATAAAAATLLAACGTTNPNQPVSSSYPTYPTTSYPTATYPATAPATTPVAGVEFGRVTDIQTVSMGATSATNPQVRNAVVGGIIGAVVGNIAGKNISGGDYRSGTTLGGAAAGAAIGSRVGQGNTTGTAGAAGPAYRVTVQTDQGAWRTYEVGATGDLRVGDRVRVENGVIYRS